MRDFGFRLQMLRKQRRITQKSFGWLISNFSQFFISLKNVFYSAIVSHHMLNILWIAIACPAHALSHHFGELQSVQFRVTAIIVHGP